MDFDRCPVERSGIMLGEYVAMEDGLLLIDRRGNTISINLPEGFITARTVFDSVNTREFWERRQSLLKNRELDAASRGRGGLQPCISQ